MATLAVVRRETNSWKWPILQLLAMGALAYLGAWFTYTIFQ
jgi:ferrous iron transport protein B